jgi:adenine-specific DNA-methyltransferase
VSKSDKRFLKLNRLKGELVGMSGQGALFDMLKKEKDEWNKKVNKLTEEISKLEAEIAAIKSNKIYEKAFEWRFEFPEVLNNDGDFVGFDVVIGNPPYIRQELFSDIKELLKADYSIYNSIADLLTYFVELSFNILKEKGTFQFIISGKFTRARFGQSMRKFLSEKTQITHYIDFGGSSIFEEATVDTSIIGFVKKRPNNNCQFLQALIEKGDDYSDDFSRYIKKNSHLFNCDSLSSSNWSFENSEISALIKKVQSTGLALKEWDIKINFGIKTGYNEAFVINREIREKLILGNFEEKEIIRPLIRGRDIKRYQIGELENWLICTFPSLKIDINNYPSIKEYLSSFGERIEQSGKVNARKKTMHKWFETQDNIAFWEDFSKPKLVWKRIGSILRFSYDDSGSEIGRAHV